MPATKTKSGAHRLTATQRRVLRWMQESEFTVRIETGFKRTTCTVSEYGDSIIRCQTLVPYFLRVHGYIETTGGISAWQLTEKGERVAERIRTEGSRAKGQTGVVSAIR